MGICDTVLLSENLLRKGMEMKKKGDYYLTQYQPLLAIEYLQKASSFFASSYDHNPKNKEAFENLGIILDEIRVYTSELQGDTREILDYYPDRTIAPMDVLRSKGTRTPLEIRKRGSTPSKYKETHIPVRMPR